MTSNAPIPTLIVDNQPEFRQTLTNLLSLYNKSDLLNLNLIGEADCFESALKLLNRYEPNLILLDLELKQENGIKLIKYLQINYPNIKTLVLSSHKEEDWIFKAMKAGANGYIFKANIIKHFCEAVKTILNLEVYLPPEVATLFFSHFNHSIVYKKREFFELTNREKEVLTYLVEGYSNREIAKKLYITVATVKAHMTAIFNKLGVKNRYQAVIVAIKQDIID